MAKISKAFLGTLLATSGWFQNKTQSLMRSQRHSRMDRCQSIFRYWSGAVSEPLIESKI